MASPEVTIQANLEGVEQVTAGFNQMGEAAGTMGSKVGASSNQMEIGYRRLAMTTAGLIANSVQLGDIMSRMATGQMDVGRGAVMLAMNFLQLSSQLYLLDSAYKTKISTQLISIVGDIKETASSTAHAIAEHARQAAIWITDLAHKAKITSQVTSIALDAKQVAGAVAHAAAEGIRQAAIWATVIAEHARAVAHAIANALSGPVGWAILAGAAVAAAIGIGMAASIPSKQYGGLVTETRPYLLHEGEFVIPKETVHEISPFVVPKETHISITINESRTPRETGDAVVDALRRAGVVT